jgi:hypothetical protein
MTTTFFITPNSFRPETQEPTFELQNLFHFEIDANEDDERKEANKACETHV